jgi:HEAT repeat protein
MNMKADSIARARARTTFIAAAALVLAAWPFVSGAQTVARVAPKAVQAPPVVVQVPPVVVQVPDVDALRLSLDSVRPALADLSMMKLDALRDLDLSNLDLSLAELQAQQGKVVVRGSAPVVRVYEGDQRGMYDAGISAIDGEQWQRAIDRFDRVIAANKTRVDGAMYWKAYALDKLGQRNDALTTLQALEKTYPNSRYLDDAKALALEVRKDAGQEVKPEEQANQELKLIALTSVMQADPERGIPLLEQIIKGNNPLKIKQRALFLLSTNDSPRARDVLAGMARGGANPDLQMKALRYLGMRRGANTQLLADIYAGSKDPDVKREIIRSLMMAHDVDRLLNIAKTEPAPELRVEAIRQLGMMRADSQLMELYGVENSGEIREQIFRSMVMSGDAERAAQMAKQEADAKVRASAVRSLGTMDRAKTGDALAQIYKSDKDQGVKKAVISALDMQQNARALVDLARQEGDPTLKKEIVSRLSTMKSKEATDYMLELLK